MKRLLILFLVATAGCSSADTLPVPVPVPVEETPDGGRECLIFRFNKIEPNCAEVPSDWTCTHSTDLCFCCENK